MEITDVECRFVERSVALGGFYYDQIYVKGPDGAGRLRVSHPPQTGDLVFLADALNDSRTGTYRVVARSWMHSTFGSFNWPYGKNRQQVPPEIELLVEKAEGWYADEIVRPEDAAEFSDSETT